MHQRCSNIRRSVRRPRRPTPKKTARDHSGNQSLSCWWRPSSQSRSLFIHWQMFSRDQSFLHSNSILLSLHRDVSSGLFYWYLSIYRLNTGDPVMFWRLLEKRVILTNYENLVGEQNVSDLWRTGQVVASWSSYCSISRHNEAGSSAPFRLFVCLFVYSLTITGKVCVNVSLI